MKLDDADVAMPTVYGEEESDIKSRIMLLSRFCLTDGSANFAKYI